MPYRPDTMCKEPMCSALVPYGKKYCDKHEPLHKRDWISSSKRGYDSRWQKARKRFLARPENVLCAMCMKQGVYKKATIVDHIVPHRGDSGLFWDETNWQALCKKCHDKKTMTEDRYQEYKF